MKEEILKEVINMDIRDKFRYFIRLEENVEKDEWERIYQEVRYGIDLKFDLLDTFIDENVEYDQKNKRIMIGGKNGLEFKPGDFQMEMIKREARIDESVENYGMNDEIMEARD